MSKFKKITNEFDYRFNIAKDGLYSVTLQASCKSGKILGLFGGEDLRVEIDGIKLREIPAKKRPQYFNIPPAWNGTKLKGLFKIIVFILRLKKGEHIIRFIPKRGAIIKKEPEVKLINRRDKILQNIQAQDGNRRPWITLALIDLLLKTLNISATCEKIKRDSDDIKLIINGKIQKNNQANWWGKSWYWRGSQLRGDIKEGRFYPNLSRGNHYIEFWADRMPILNEVKVDLGEIKILEDETKTDSKRVPTVDDPKWTGDFNDDTEQMILARAIFGEARDIRLSDKARIAVGWSIKNRVNLKTWWGKTYHEVILKPKHYSAFNKNKDNPNRAYVEDPLWDNKVLDKKSWLNCYKIADQVIRGEIDDPVDGATCYHDISYSQRKFVTKDVPGAKFIKKIDRLMFYFSPR